MNSDQEKTHLTGLGNYGGRLLVHGAGVTIELAVGRVRYDQVLGRVEPLVIGVEWLGQVS